MILIRLQGDIHINLTIDVVHIQSRSQTIQSDHLIQLFDVDTTLHCTIAMFDLIRRYLVRHDML